MLLDLLLSSAGRAGSPAAYGEQQGRRRIASSTTSVGREIFSMAQDIAMGYSGGLNGAMQIGEVTINKK
jgi:hypothetical protein